MKIATVGDNLNFNIDRATGEVIEVHNDMTFEQREADLQAIEQAEKRKQKKAMGSPYDNWAQMNLDHTEDWMILSRKNHVAAEILWFLIKHSNLKNAVVCSCTVLEEALGYSSATITRAIKCLKDNNFVDIKKSGTTNVYLINRVISWKSYGSNYKYAEFDAQILIAESEQEKTVAVKDTKINMTEIKIKQPVAVV